MFGFPASTEFGKRIPKQKFYENIDITPTLKRVFVEQIRLIYWRNKLATTTLNLAAGEAVKEIEVFEVRLNAPQLDEAVLRQIDTNAKLEMDAFVIDAAWYSEDGQEENWLYQNGDWFPEKLRYEIGYDGLAQYCHDRGLLFGLWMEPER